MKLRGFLFILLSMMCLCVSAKVQTLSICIGDYPTESGWNSLGANNDAHLIKDIFPDVKMVANGNATHDRILSELSQLKRDVNRGDTVIVHFSGHGQQILSETSTEEADMVDEALVPYDATKRKTAIYNGQSHITDDVFGEYITGIRAAAGLDGLVIAVIDACHSDSMDKDAESSDDVYRGTDEIFGAETISPDSIANLRELYNAPDESSVFASPELSDVVFISACGTHQRNYEIKVGDTQYGSLTYYFCKAYEAKGISNLSDFLCELYDKMSSDKTMKFHGQTPVIRNTVGWETSQPSIYEPSDPPLKVVNGESHKSYWWCCFLGAFIVIALIFVICRKKTK